MGTILVNTTSAFSDGDQITSDSLNNLIDDAILNTTAVSAGTGLTVNGTTGVLSLDSSLTGKVLTGGSLNNAPIGSSTPSTGAFTTLSSSSGYTGNVTGGTGSFTTLSASGDVNFDSNTLFVDASTNNVGIGTTTPQHKLDIRAESDAAISTGLLIANTASSSEGTGTAIRMVHSTSQTSNSASTISSERAASNGSIIGLNLSTDGSAVPSRVMTLLGSNGNVGIGTTSPDHKLSVYGDSSGNRTEIGIDNIDQRLVLGAYFETGVTQYSTIQATNNAETSATNLALQPDGGNVGIGTTSPDHTLDVSGEFRVNGGGTGSIVVNDEDSSLCPTMTFLRNGGGTTTNDFIKFENSGGEVAAINATGGGYFSGNVGIGTTPSHKLDVNSGATNQVALFESTDETALIELADNTGSVQFITLGSGDLRIATGGSAGGGGSPASGLYITQGQDVGIGDDTPSFKLDVNGTGRFVGDLTLDEELIHNLTGSGSLPGYDADGTGGTFGAVLEDGGANGSTLYMARKNSWALYLATDTNINPQSDTGKKKVVQFADLYNQTSTQGNVVGNIAINDSSTAFNTSSDYRLKENEVNITDGIDRLKELKPYRFNFIRNPSEVVDGFFAHEVSPVVPESITGSKDAVDEEGKPDYQGIDQSKLVPLLTAALQEAVAKIEALEARVATLEG